MCLDKKLQVFLFEIISMRITYFEVYEYKMSYKNVICIIK